MPAPAPLHPRKLLFAAPAVFQVRISPDGEWLSWLELKDDKLGLVVAPVSDPAEKRPALEDGLPDAMNHLWVADDRIVCLLGEGGRGTIVAAAGVHARESKKFLAGEGMTLRLYDSCLADPTQVILDSRALAGAAHDWILFDARSGDTEFLYRAAGVDGLLLSATGEPRYASTWRPSGHLFLYALDEERTVVDQIPADVVPFTRFLGLDRQGLLWTVDARDTDTQAVVKTNLEAGKRTVVYADPKADVVDVYRDPESGVVTAAAVTRLRKSWKPLDKSMEPVLAAAEALDAGDLAELHPGGNRWLFSIIQDRGSLQYHLWEKDGARFLFSNLPDLDDAVLSRMHPVKFKSRDGKTLTGYMSLPVQSDAEKLRSPGTPLPLVVLVHGGPWSRDRWGYHPYHQWLANRGYAVLSVNYRGSVGFGRGFVDAANAQWGQAMQNDLEDGIRWAMAENIADPSRIAVFGSGYGGFAALRALADTDVKVACAVALAPPLDLLHAVGVMWGSVPPVARKVLDKAGSPSSLEGTEVLNQESPLHRAREFHGKVLMAVGSEDPLVPLSQVQEFTRTLKDVGVDISVAVFEGTGHRLASVADREVFLSLTEDFLHQNLGGRVEPADDLADAKANVLQAGRFETSAANGLTSASN